ncbi:MAG: 50S ribosomal protein L30e [Methanobacteriota archaeon]|nr:MAG: 50S ribosomal protein L30e [Euryarchaeota archaeon]
MNIAKSIRTAVDTGKVLLGTKRTLEAVLSGDAKLAVVASNAERESKEDLMRYAGLSGVHVHEFRGSGVELGEVCGKPFVVSMLAVLETGESDILELKKSRKEG